MKGLTSLRFSLGGAGLLAFLLFPGVAQPEASSDHPHDGDAHPLQEMSRYAIRCQASLWDHGNKVRLSGRCPVPDSTVLRVRVKRQLEWRVGTQFGWELKPDGDTRFMVVDGSFSGDVHIQTPGILELTITIDLSYQDSEVLPTLKGVVPQSESWQFGFALWDGEFIQSLVPHLDQVLTFARETATWIEKVEKAAATESGWKAEERALITEGEALERKLFAAQERLIFPISIMSLYYKLIAITKPIKPRTKDLDAYWSEIKAPFDVILLGREFVFWLIKDLRRTQGKRSPEWNEVLAKEKDAPGVKEWAKHLKTAALSDLDELEKKIRGTDRLPPFPQGR